MQNQSILSIQLGKFNEDLFAATLYCEHKQTEWYLKWAWLQCLFLLPVDIECTKPQADIHLSLNCVMDETTMRPGLSVELLVSAAVPGD